MLCLFLTNINMNQPYVSICPFSPKPPFHLLSHPSMLSQNTKLRSLCHTANSQSLYILHMVMHMFQCYSIWDALDKQFSKMLNLIALIEKMWTLHIITLLGYGWLHSLIQKYTECLVHIIFYSYRKYST